MVGNMNEYQVALYFMAHGVDGQWLWDRVIKFATWQHLQWGTR